MFFDYIQPLSYPTSYLEAKEVSAPSSYSMFYRAVNNAGQEILILGINHYLNASTFPPEVIGKFIRNQVLVHETRYNEITASAENTLVDDFKFKEELSLHLLNGNWDHFEKILKEIKINDSKIKKYKNLFYEKQKEFNELIESQWQDQLPEKIRNRIKEIAEKFNINLDSLHPIFVLELLNCEKNSLRRGSVEKYLIENFASQNKQRVELDDSEVINHVLNYAFIKDLKCFNLSETINESQNLSHLNMQEFEEFVLGSYKEMCENPHLWDVHCMVEDPEDDMVVTYRNKIWELTIQHSLELYQNFSLLVGYDHLKGNNGLLKFLLDNGFVIEQIILSQQKARFNSY